MSFAFYEAYENQGKHFPMKDTAHVTKTLSFFRLLGVICLFSINIRILVHFFCLHWEMKSHLARENLWEARNKINTRPVPFYLPMRTKKVYFNP